MQLSKEIQDNVQCGYVLSACQCVCGSVTLLGEKRLSLGEDLEKESAHSMGMLSL